LIDFIFCAIDFLLWLSVDFIMARYCPINGFDGGSSYIGGDPFKNPMR
jgi:uncharacterized membrane protein